MRLKKDPIIFGIAQFPNGESRVSRNYVDPEAFSRWANKQFRKDERVRVTEFRNYKVYSEWRA